jgi:DNA (cytosine-5)-methyltransferase 1
MLNELELFAGAGGGILGSQMLGHRTICAVEYDAYARSVLLARQADGTFPHFPVWDDVRTFDGLPWRGIVDVVSGGFPCQDISVAGKGAGIDGERSGLWGEMARVVGEVRPRFVFVENSPALVTRGLGRVLSDLSALGYDSRWTVMGAADVGAPHQRDRLWIFATNTNSKPDGIKQPHAGERIDYPSDVLDVADSDRLRELQPQGSQQDERGRIGDSGSYLANAYSAQRQGNECSEREWPEHADISSPSWWSSEPGMGRMVDGLANRAYRLKAIGNGQVPQCRAAAWKLLMSQIKEGTAE